MTQIMQKELLPAELSELLVRLGGRLVIAREMAVPSDSLSEIDFLLQGVSDSQRNKLKLCFMI